MSYNFHCTSRYTTVNDKFLLSALSQKIDGSWIPAAIELNTVLGNDDGKFTWNSTNFGLGAKDVKLIDGHILSAYLKRNNESWAEKPVKIDLADRIENLDGKLHCNEKSWAQRVVVRRGRRTGRSSSLGSMG